MNNIDRNAIEAAARRIFEATADQPWEAANPDEDEWASVLAKSVLVEFTETAA
jgi:hypothetical protein